jgi:hypothetical protein|tara:strand:+ start:11414 stop:12388 length:975 start_codon:yes stop_codon:yes gene_type:complete
MQNKIKVAFVFHKDNYFLSGKHFDNTYYNFFMKALKRNNRLSVQNFKTETTFDCSKLKDKVDVILLWENSPFGMPRELYNIQDLEIPIISRTGDPSRAKESKKLHNKWKIDYYFDFFSESFFHSLYPKEFKYKKIFFGVEESLFKNLKPFNERIKNKILNSGNIGNDKFLSKIINDIRNPKWNNYRCKVLRTKCSKLEFVDYSFTQNHDYVNDRYPLLLEKYQSAIAADSYTPVQKYWEIPAAGCLTFMEITNKNDGEHIGFKDNETAIFIDEKNYEEKFLEYLDDQNNPKWKEIAEAGREFALKNFNNDLAINNLSDLIEELI